MAAAPPLSKGLFSVFQKGLLSGRPLGSGGRAGATFLPLALDRILIMSKSGGANSGSLGRGGTKLIKKRFSYFGALFFCWREEGNEGDGGGYQPIFNAECHHVDCLLFFWLFTRFIMPILTLFII